MQTFLQTVVVAVGSGSLDALLALGIVLIYRTTGVLNFAQAAIGTFGAYVMYAVAQGRPLWLGIIASLAAAGLTGALTYIAVGSIQTRQRALATAVATLAVAVLIQQVIRVSWGTTAGQFPNPFGFGSVDVGGVLIAYFTIAGVATAAGLAVLLGAFLRWTRTGTMLRAVADHADAARLSGANVALLLAAVWAAAGMLAAVAGFFAAQIVFDPAFLDPFFVAALIAAVLGGLRSLFGAFMGAIGLELAGNLFQTYAPVTVTPYAQTVLLIILIAVLVLAPRRWLAQGPERLV